MQQGVNFLNPDYFYQKLYDLLAGLSLYELLLYLIALLVRLVLSLKFWLILLALFLAVGVIYCIIRIRQVREEGEARMFTEVEEDLAPVENPKWKKVREHLAADDSGSWRLAILEADIMLEELLEGMGYPGATIGDRLKQVRPDTFAKLDAAWEAHKVRNRIAHEGAEFSLSAHEARRVITLYEEVFREYKFI